LTDTTVDKGEVSRTTVSKQRELHFKKEGSRQPPHSRDGGGGGALKKNYDEFIRVISKRFSFFLAKIFLFSLHSFFHSPSALFLLFISFHLVISFFFDFWGADTFATGTYT